MPTCEGSSNVADTEKIKVIAVVGPTAIGKTALSVELAKQLNGEIISCDSMQVYRQMDIGTAKITEEERQGIPHYLLDRQNYDEPYNVKIFQEACRESIRQIHDKGKTVILCGGTGLYLKAALYDYAFSEEEPDEKLSQELESLSNEELWQRLEKLDPKALEKIHPNNRKRLIRALQIAGSGRIKSEEEARQEHKPLYDVLFLGLEADRELIHERIARRVDIMFDEGLPDEVRRLFSNPKTWDYTSFQGIGYKEFRPWLEGTADLEEVKEKIVVHTRQYAKRQFTWFRNQMPVRWFDMHEREKAIMEAEDFIHGQSKNGSADRA